MHWRILKNQEIIIGIKNCSLEKSSKYFYNYICINADGILRNKQNNICLYLTFNEISFSIQPNKFGKNNYVEIFKQYFLPVSLLYFSSHVCKVLENKIGRYSDI